MKISTLKLNLNAVTIKIETENINDTHNNLIYVNN